VEASALELLLVLVGGRFDPILRPPDFAIEVMILVEQLGEVGVADLEIVDRLLVVGEFVEEVVVLTQHGVLPEGTATGPAGRSRRPDARARPEAGR
jgi:hypothetical protein